jgi:5'-3' exonuclease
MPRKPLVHLFDAHVYVFRAYFSLPAMEAPDGTPSQAAYGFANSLIRYLGEREPTHLACCFDHSLTSFRNGLLPGYKSSRGEPPADLEPQFELCAEVARALGVPVFEAPDYEADDVIATLVDRLVPAGARVVVVSSDKDLSQLVTEDDRVVLYDLARDRTLDADGVRAKFGVAPDQIPDYLGLVGDAVDDLPGVPGVGPKSAAAALGTFGSLDALPASANEWEAVPVRGARRLAERIAEHREQALTMRDLATLVRDVPGIEASLGALAWPGAHAKAVEKLFDRLGWGRIATRIPRWCAVPGENQTLF